jgi:release factor glutamine methyltransferase
MKAKYKSMIRTLLLEGGSEDLNRDLDLVSFHLERSTNLQSEALRLIEELKKGIPLCRIIGYSLVCGIPIKINEDVLDPGPETVTLVEEAVKYIRLKYASSALDLCCGSGAVAIAMAKICKIHVTAIDISEPALKVARANALTNSVRIEFLQGDLFQPVEGRKFGIIVSNPPYVKTAEIASLPRFIRDFAPKIAIDGGVDGLYFHRKILSQAGKFLNSLGPLFLECEDGQDEAVIELCRLNNWDVTEKYLNRYGRVRGFKLLKK